MCRSRWVGRWDRRVGRWDSWVGRWDGWVGRWVCIILVHKGAANAGNVVKGVGDGRLSRGFGVGIHFKSEACSKNEVVEVLDETRLIGRVNVCSSMAKFRIKLVGDE